MSLPPSTYPTQLPSSSSQAVEGISESQNYDLVYELDIPVHPQYTFFLPAYSQDNHDTLPYTSFGRIAYYLELDDKYVWVSMDAFTSDSRRIGVPTLSTIEIYGSATVFQQELTNMVIESNVPGLSGSGLTGNIEFWPYDSYTMNPKGIDGASDCYFDAGDTNRSIGNYGSMQIHVWKENGPKTVFAFNRFHGFDADLGIGNNPNGQPDWSFTSNANTYNTRIMRVFTKESDGI